MSAFSFRGPRARDAITKSGLSSDQVEFVRALVSREDANTYTLKNLESTRRHQVGQSVGSISLGFPAVFSELWIFLSLDLRESFSATSRWCQEREGSNRNESLSPAFLPSERQCTCFSTYLSYHSIQPQAQRYKYLSRLPQHSTIESKLINNPTLLLQLIGLTVNYHGEK